MVLLRRKSFSTVFNGLVALSLSLVIWRLTGNVWGWLVLFLPGGLLVFYGYYLMFIGK
jgi:hypothetical protein